MPVIGIDLGTQSLKAVVVDLDLVLRGEASVPYQPSFPAPGWAEQDPGLWLRALKPAISRALAAAGVAPADIKGIAVAGQLDGCVPVGADGQALAPCIIWMDRRAQAEVAGIDADLIRRRTGLVLDATHMAAKIRWMRRHLPETRAARPGISRCRSSSRRSAAARSWTTRSHRRPCSTASRSAAMPTTCSDLFEIDRASLPEIDDATAMAGALSRAGAELTGLPAGTPVAVGTGDDFANPIGAGVVAPGIVACSLGTAEVIGTVSDSLRIDDEGLVETHGFLGDRFLVSNPGWLAGGAVTWFLSTFGVATPAELSRLARKRRPAATA